MPGPHVLLLAVDEQRRLCKAKKARRRDVTMNNLAAARFRLGMTPFWLDRSTPAPPREAPLTPGRDQLGYVDGPAPMIGALVAPLAVFSIDVLRAVETRPPGQAKTAPAYTRQKTVKRSDTLARRREFLASSRSESGHGPLASASPILLRTSHQGLTPSTPGLSTPWLLSQAYTASEASTGITVKGPVALWSRWSRRLDHILEDHTGWRLGPRVLPTMQKKRKHSSAPRLLVSRKPAPSTPNDFVPIKATKTSLRLKRLRPHSNSTDNRIPRSSSAGPSGTPTPGPLPRPSGWIFALGSIDVLPHGEARKV
jgi:hypothetical protein